MRSAVVAVVLAGITAAQDLSLPSCAQGCVTKYTTGGGIAGCGQLDIKCICSNAGFLDGIACCLADACPKADQDAAVKYAKNICSTADVTVPDQVTCKSASASGSGIAQSTAASQTSAAASQTSNPAVATNTPNAAATMGPVALLGGLIAALAVL